MCLGGVLGRVARGRDRPTRGIEPARTRPASWRPRLKGTGGNRSKDLRRRDGRGRPPQYDDAPRPVRGVLPPEWDFDRVGPPVQGGCGLPAERRAAGGCPAPRGGARRSVSAVRLLRSGRRGDGCRSRLSLPHSRRSRALRHEDDARRSTWRKAALAPVALARATPAAAYSAGSASCTAVHGVATGGADCREPPNTPGDGAAQAARSSRGSTLRRPGRTPARPAARDERAPTGAGGGAGDRCRGRGRPGRCGPDAGADARRHPGRRWNAESHLDGHGLHRDLLRGLPRARRSRPGLERTRWPLGVLRPRRDRHPGAGGRYRHDRPGGRRTAQPRAVGRPWGPLPRDGADVLRVAGGDRVPHRPVGTA